MDSKKQTMFGSAEKKLIINKNMDLERNHSFNLETWSRKIELCAAEKAQTGTVISRSDGQPDHRQD